MSEAELLARLSRMEMGGIEPPCKRESETFLPDIVGFVFLSVSRIKPAKSQNAESYPAKGGVQIEVGHSSILSRKYYARICLSEVSKSDIA